MAPLWRTGPLAPAYAFLAGSVAAWLVGGVIIGGVSRGPDPLPTAPPETPVVIQTALPPTSTIAPPDRLPEPIAPPSGCESGRRLVPCAASPAPDRPGADGAGADEPGADVPGADVPGADVEAP